MSRFIYGQGSVEDTETGEVFHLSEPGRATDFNNLLKQIQETEPKPSGSFRIIAKPHTQGSEEEPVVKESGIVQQELFTPEEVEATARDTRAAFWGHPDF